jgi:thymidylate kinase
MLTRQFFLRGRDMDSDYVGYSSVKKSFLHRRSLAKLHETSVLTDYLIQVMFKVTIPLLLGANLICDRYVYDTVISDLAPDLGYSPQRVQEVINLCFRVMPRPDLVLWLDVPETVTLQRKSDVAARQYLSERRRIYSTIAADGRHMVALDGTMPMDQILNRVVALATRRFNHEFYGHQITDDRR